MQIDRKVWDGYDDWGKVASTGDLEWVRRRITGPTPHGWQPNSASGELVRALEFIRHDSVERYGDTGRVLDFGCGLGRNARLLREHFGRVVGHDLPEMIDKLRELPEGEVYGALHSDRSALIASEDVDVCFDSVVFQHIVDEDYCRDLIADLLRIQRLRYVVSLCNLGVTLEPGHSGWARVPLLLVAQGWEQVTEFADGDTFTKRHIYRVLRRR